MILNFNIILHEKRRDRQADANADTNWNGVATISAILIRIRHGHLIQNQNFGEKQFDTRFWQTCWKILWFFLYFFSTDGKEGSPDGSAGGS